MEQLLSNYSASISELKENPTTLLNQAEGSPIAILNHNIPAANKLSLLVVTASEMTGNLNYYSL